MNMKKLSAAVVVMLGLGVSAAQADDGSLNFTGDVSASSCSVAANTTALAVSFDGYAATSLDGMAPGTTSAALQKPFSITLAGCPEGVSVAKIKLDGKTSGIIPNAFVGNSTVRYVGIIISDAETNTIITPKEFGGDKTIAAGQNTLNYLVGLTKTSADAAVAGTVDVPVTFTMSYE
ncbi:fimbrial protein [Scandinavium lactucae]|uniref:Fimbrial protein n=1 Tax=Scandinavium lactucae TaxID=3095028 RepID=A0ABU4QKX0_9ENTR|nr:MULTISPECIES: fimbrial protein [unclassified Scandinavium]MDX6038819.1 fimbrial protein [Scandinavium sp. V105_6]MDX6049225.1 fimbrial protein [Scandinavium sp. V105_1]